MSPLAKRAMVNPARFTQNYSGKVNGDANAPKALRMGSVGNLLDKAKEEIKNPEVKKFVPKRFVPKA